MKIEHIGTVFKIINIQEEQKRTKYRSLWNPAGEDQLTLLTWVPVLSRERGYSQVVTHPSTNPVNPGLTLDHSGERHLFATRASQCDTCKRSYSSKILKILNDFGWESRTKSLCKSGGFCITTTEADIFLLSFPRELLMIITCIFDIGLNFIIYHSEIGSLPIKNIKD